MFVTSGIDYQSTSGIDVLQHINPRSATTSSGDDSHFHNRSRGGLDMTPALCVSDRYRTPVSAETYDHSLLLTLAKHRLS
jgi:hypothetical protein